MGVIQNSINQGVGAVGSALALNKHLEEQKTANALNAISQGENLLKEADTLGETAENLNEKTEGLENAKQDNEYHLGNLNRAFDSDGSVKVGDLARDSQGKWLNVEKSITKRELATKAYEEQLEAVRAQKEQFVARTEFYNKKLEALNAIDKGLAPDLSKVLPTKQLNAVDSIKKEVNR